MSVAATRYMIQVGGRGMRDGKGTLAGVAYAGWRCTAALGGRVHTRHHNREATPRCVRRANALSLPALARQDELRIQTTKCDNCIITT